MLPNLIATHLAVRLIIAAVLVPLTGALLSVVIGISGQSALTDQDIARYLLTPAGFLGALVVVSFSITVAVLELAVMIGLISRPDEDLGKALRYGVSL